MLLASVLAWPLLALGVAVAVAFYVALGYLLVAGARFGVVLVRRCARDWRDLQRAREFAGESHPTLLEVALARAPDTGSRRRLRRAA